MFNKAERWNRDRRAEHDAQSTLQPRGRGRERKSSTLYILSLFPWLLSERVERVHGVCEENASTLRHDTYLLGQQNILLIVFGTLGFVILISQMPAIAT